MLEVSFSTTRGYEVALHELVFKFAPNAKLVEISAEQNFCKVKVHLTQQDFDRTCKAIKELNKLPWLSATANEVSVFKES